MSIYDLRGAILCPPVDGPWIELSVAEAEAIELAATAPPAPPPEAPPEQPPEIEHPAADVAAVATIAAVLAAHGGADLHLWLAAKLLDLGYSPDVATGVAEVAESSTATIPAAKIGNTAARRTAAVNLTRRAQFIVNAAHRVTTAIGSGTPVSQALATERGFWDAHRAAGTARMAAARKVDAVAGTSKLMRWTAVHDSRTDPRCLALDGRMFTVDKPPGGTYPGQPHPDCRCTATPIRTTTQLSRKDTNMIELAHEQGQYGALPDAGWGPIEAPVYDRSGRRLDTPAADPDDRFGAFAPAPSDETIGMVNWLRRNNPALFPHLNDLTDHEVAKRLIVAPVRVPVGFDPRSGAQRFHAQMPVGGYEESDVAFARPGESEHDRRLREDYRHATTDAAQLLLDGVDRRKEAAAYARRYGLV